MTTTGYDLDALRVTFPRWVIFRSDAGAFYATRRGVALSAAEISAGIQQTVCADDLGGLVGVLQEQDIRR
ncbi:MULTISPECIES: hypothetical protein [Streptosporangium]|uniref:DUF5753 domain-containing protein n=1 Tax=Streptosporangium brasiliense TaxID=47480 RepID=A0ABT9R2L2_9ACTN|nr:hypothetical protein [Streptosporangium brasiliense]MDP9863471.1 hypothetical protein [Streptosporangium brasiliense]